MNTAHHHNNLILHRYSKRWLQAFSVWLILSIAIPWTVFSAVPVARAKPATAPALTNTLTLSVISARTEPRFNGGAGVTKGSAIITFNYIINIDNTGTTEQRAPSPDCTPDNPGYPGTCHWVSIAGAASHSPIYQSGDQDDFNGVLGTGITFPVSCTALAPCRYLISVLADGYKLDGVHFSIPLEDPGLVTVELQPTPLPAATIQAAVFEDNAIPNSAPDVPVEHGLAGFKGQITDYLGLVTTDIFGNPMCTEYEKDVNGNVILNPPDYIPTPIPGTGGSCNSACYIVSGGLDIGTVAPIDAMGRCPADATGLTLTLEGDPIPAGAAVEGKVIIPNLGTNRYALSVIPPDGSGWIQTTTLEGNHDWDAWVMEGATGLDTEFVIGGEPFPAIFFGYLQPTPMPASAATGEIKGVIDAVKVYVPTVGGLALPGTIWGGMAGAKIDKPIDSPWIALTDLTSGDAAIYVGQGNADGSFDITNVPDGNYTLTWWDEPQDYILDLINVTVSNGEVVDLGVLPLTGWWTNFDGYVFNDTNRNGVMDWTDTNMDGCPNPGEGERGIANFTLTMRKRENSLMDRGTTIMTTDQCGHYFAESAYPMTQWLILEAYNDMYYTTGVTYQADNQPDPTTIVGAGVDVSVLPIIGLSGRLDWGVHAYDPTGASGGVDPRNGGIVGTVSYDTTRNELDPRYAAVEDWQPGISDLNVNLYATVACPVPQGTADCDPSGSYLLVADGSYAKGNLLNSYVTETWQRPGLNGDGVCIPRNVDGNRLAYPADQQVTNNDSDCLEGPLMGLQFQNGYSSVDGNYGFADGCFGFGGYDPNTGTCADLSAPTPLPGGREYLVEVVIPNDSASRSMYQVTREEDINIANGDQFVPQVPPPACAGPLHTVDVAGIGVDSYPAVNIGNGIIVPASTPVINSTFADNLAGSPYEGLQKPLCNTKLVQLNNGKSIVPTFNLFTDVPIPGRFWGLIVDDLNFSSNPKSLLYGEKAGVPFAPVGIYDYTNRLVATVESDYNGLFDVLLPSTNRISCPTPSGVCANLYRFVGNDPGVPGRLNPNYNPQFRTIAAEFEAFPGLLVPADLAPTQVGVTIQLPGSQFNSPVSCALDTTTPQLFAVSKPYVNLTGGGSGFFTIQGLGFGATKGNGAVTLDNAIPLLVTSWSDTQINVTVPASTSPGPYQLKITASNGKSTVNGLTFHVLSAGSYGVFPTNAVLDNFNRSTTSTTQSLGTNWSNDGQVSTIFRITPTSLTGFTNQVQVRSTGSTVWTRNSFSANQEAYFTFTKVSTTGTEQALLLKFNGASANAPLASWIEVAYNATNSTVRIRTKTPNQGIVNRGSPIAATFSAGNRLGARAASDGTVIVYKNSVEIGRFNVTTGPNPWSTLLAAAGGRVGVRFVGPTTTNDARFDNFGGGNITLSAAYQPNLYEVGPGKTYAPANTLPLAANHAIQNALDAAAASPGNDLVVVYPGLATPLNPRQNPRGAYYENLIISSPVKLQGVGPGGFQGATFVPGSIIDGGAFAGDSPVTADWYTKIGSLTWDGNQNINDGAVISIFTQTGEFKASFKAAIDGFNLSGGDQQGFPTNINVTGGGPTGLPAAVVTQGGAVFANAYAQYLQITNNVIENNGGGYGTIRLGTPDLPVPNTNQHNENTRIAFNRIIANGGTNLAGGIGLFAGADNYEVANNDICGNFSAEYGGGLSVYGYSPNGKIHDNRIYLNRSYDEGGGIMIAGQLPTNPATLSPGSGPVEIYDNLIQANLGNDDGGGLRFLMAGNFPMYVVNNMIVNNISTHEGGGVSLNDTPDMRLYNNTIMKNITTATAVTSNGLPAPAGLSSSANSSMLQATLPGGAPIFSNPLLFNNIFWDNRAGTRAGACVTGIGATCDPTPTNIFHWDLGVADGSGLLSPTNSMLQVGTGAIPSLTNQVGVDPAVTATFDMNVAFTPWRTNPNFVDAIMVTVDVPPNLMGNYHLQAMSTAVNAGAASKTVGTLTVGAPTFDIDGNGRPSSGGYEIGADELPGPVPVFPATGLLDPFSGLALQALSNPSAPDTQLGPNWAGDTSTSIFNVVNGAVQVLNSGSVYWDARTFGANQEVYFTFTKVEPSATKQALFLKFSGTSPSSADAALIEVAYDATTDNVIISTLAPEQGWIGRTAFGATFAAGDQFGARALEDGLVNVYQNGALIGSVNIYDSPNPWPQEYRSSGKIGVTFAALSFAPPHDSGFDDFGGGTIPGTQEAEKFLFLPIIIR